MPKTIIVDIDGTLMNGDSGIQKTIDYVNEKAKDHKIIIITGRLETERAKTIAALKKNKIQYNRLIMNPYSTAQSVSYKKAAALRLQKLYHIVMAIENNPNARNAYSSLEINAVNPTDLP
jgi:hydroxymethylpyrimidine pyrophosphatase-like HAD family hydrolase